MDAKTILFVFLFNFLCLFLNTLISQGADTISTNQSISGDQTIVSPSGIFELGFFKPGNSSNYYIGMWHKIDPMRTVLWLANREKPVSDKYSSVLQISNGNLVLFSESNVPVWFTNVKSTNSLSVQAILLDSGNLILNYDGSNSSNKLVLWQSFDHPTHTFLLDSKLGYNKITKTKLRLTSWKNSEDPSQGHFSFEIDTSDNSFTIQWINSSRNYGTTGPWNGNAFSLVPEMNFVYICRFQFSSDHNGSYLTHTLINSSTISQFVLDGSGQIQQRVWLPTTGWKILWSFPRQQCQVYDFCGAFGSCNEKSLPFCTCLLGFKPKSPKDWDLKDYSGGCLRKTKLQCANNSSSLANGARDRFLEMPSVSLPENKQSMEVDNVVDCESTCLSNCSCVAYAYDNNVCSTWMDHLLNLQQLKPGDSSGSTLFIRLAASEFPGPQRKKGIALVIICLVAGLAVFLGVIVLIILRRVRRKVRARKALEGSFVVFGYKDLQNATKNFAEILGRGGFGSVFKGILADSTVVAVKKLESVSQGEKQFRAEVSTIGTIQHVNLIRLRGFCSEGTKKFLVCDYMSNGSVDSHLFRKNNSNVLDWKTRYQIALGTARGLAYLHEKCRECIIHCDIKPENILLDTEFCPKVADFGLAKLLGREFSRVLTTMRGTRGYLAPEWIGGVAITSKADVYSYGMMLFEFVSGRRNIDQSESNRKVYYFPSLAASVVVEHGNVLSLLDSRLEGNADIDELERICRVACWCVQDDEGHRPSMSQVIQILEGATEVNLPPVPRSLHFYDDNEDNLVFFTELPLRQSSREQSNVSASSQSKNNTSVM